MYDEIWKNTLDKNEIITSMQWMKVENRFVSTWFTWTEKGTWYYNALLCLKGWFHWECYFGKQDVQDYGNLSLQE